MMRLPMNFVRCWLGFFFLTHATHSFAGSINLHGNFLYFSLASENENNGTKTEGSSSHRLLRGGACYFVETSWCLGLDVLQLVRKDEADMQSSVVNVSGDGELTWTATGATISYIAKPAFISGTFFFTGEREASEQTLTTDIAWAIEAGYAVDVKGVTIGPLISYMNFDYGKVKDSNGTERMDGNASDSFLLPSLALWINL